MNKEAYIEMYDNEDRHWWFVARRRIIGKVLSDYLHDKRERRILEIGCGTGGNLGLLSAYGDIYAMELADEALEMARKRGLFNVVKGSLPGDIPFNGGFDLICMLDVLEHIGDDKSALEKIREKLRPGGKLLITVPACRFLWSQHDVALHHKRRYSKNELTGLVEASGFRILYNTYFNTILFPLITAIRILKKTGGYGYGTDVTMPSRPLNWILKTLFSAERVFIPHLSLPFGISILLIAEI